MPHRILPLSIRRFTLLAFVPLLGILLMFTQTTPALAACPVAFPVDVPAGNTARLIEVSAPTGGTAWHPLHRAGHRACSNAPGGGRRPGQMGMVWLPPVRTCRRRSRDADRPATVD